jgi:hypothetical protein
MHWISIIRSLYFKNFWASFLITYCLQWGESGVSPYWHHYNVCSGESQMSISTGIITIFPVGRIRCQSILASLQCLQWGESGVSPYWHHYIVCSGESQMSVSTGIITISAVGRVRCQSCLLA